MIVCLEKFGGAVSQYHQLYEEMKNEMRQSTLIYVRLIKKIIHSILFYFLIGTYILIKNDVNYKLIVNETKI